MIVSGASTQLPTTTSPYDGSPNRPRPDVHAAALTRSSPLQRGSAPLAAYIPSAHIPSAHIPSAHIPSAHASCFLTPSRARKPRRSISPRPHRPQEASCVAPPHNAIPPIHSCARSIRLTSRLPSRYSKRRAAASRASRVASGRVRVTTDQLLIAALAGVVLLLLGLLIGLLAGRRAHLATSPATKSDLIPLSP